MKFKNILEFENKVIEKLVQDETKKYYYKMKELRVSSKEKQHVVNDAGEQLSLFG